MIQNLLSWIKPKTLSLFVFQFLLTITHVFSLSGSGFPKGTLVKTSVGHIPIEQLTVNDTVVCYNFHTKKYLEQPIAHISQKESESIIQITLNENILYADHDQQFYILAEKKWCKAGNLKVGDVLLCQNHAPACIRDIQKIIESGTVFDITIERYHNFCISEQNIVVHNFVIAIPILAWGAGGLTFFEGVTVVSALSAFAAAVFYSTLEKTTGVETNNEVNLNGTVNGHSLQHPENTHNNNDNTIVAGTSAGTGGPCWCGHFCGIGCGCLCPCGCSLQHRNMPSQNHIPNNLKNNELNNSQRLSFTRDAIEEGVKYAMTDAKRAHIFENPEHKLDPLVIKLGGQENVIRAVINALNNEALVEGVFKDLKIEVAGHCLYVRGRIMNGVPKIGTLFIK